MRTAAGLASNAGGSPDSYLEKSVTEFVWWVEVIDKMLSDSKKKAEAAANKKK